jgi:ATP-dependent DNA ligase
VTLPLRADYAPMEARLVDEVPVGPTWQYEPKWDGFRCLAFRDGDDVVLRSRSGKPLERYFPDVVAAVRAVPASRFVLDGELVVPVGAYLAFDELLQRIHPAASRVRRLAAERPAMYIVFDLLVDDEGRALVGLPLAERRRRLEAFARRQLARADSIRLSPATNDLEAARAWLSRAGGNLDGVMAKVRDVPYLSGTRDGMVKVKRGRTADCVVGGFRYASSAKVVGSLLLGLYDDAGLLHHVGFTSGFAAPDRKALVARLRPLMGGSGFTGNAPGGPSRWSTERSGEWEPLEPKLVVEVGYDQVTAGRFRHGTRLLRWRPDKAPRQCTLEQLASGAQPRLAALLDGAASAAPAAPRRAAARSRAGSAARRRG